jgi:hypothetical protein
MLENPQDESVVRWGNEGDSFVVLEAGLGRNAVKKARADARTEREVHETHITKTLQAQQLCQLCAPAEQVRFPQSAAQQRGGRYISIRSRCKWS